MLIISNMSHIIKQIIQRDKEGPASAARPDCSGQLKSCSRWMWGREQGCMLGEELKCSAG